MANFNPSAPTQAGLSPVSAVTLSPASPLYQLAQDNTALEGQAFRTGDFLSSGHQCLPQGLGHPSPLQLAQAPEASTHSETKEKQTKGGDPGQVFVKHGLALTAETALHEGAHHALQRGGQKLALRGLAHLGKYAVGGANGGGALINVTMTALSGKYAIQAFDNGNIAAGLAYGGAALLDGGAATAGIVGLAKGKFMMSSRVGLAIGVGATVLATAGAVLDD